jgi:hypothetical protein
LTTRTWESVPRDPRLVSSKLEPGSRDESANASMLWEDMLSMMRGKQEEWDLGHHVYQGSGGSSTVLNTAGLRGPDPGLNAVLREHDLPALTRPSRPRIIGPCQRLGAIL